MRKLQLLPLIGFLVLSSLVLVLTGLGGLETLKHHLLFTIIKTVVLISLITELITDAKVSVTQQIFPLERRDLLLLLSVLTGALLAFWISIALDHGGVIASAIVGITAGILVPSYAVPIYCGSFIGMASPALFPSYLPVVIAALFSGVLYVITEDLFKGAGGKLGTIAFAGSLAAAAILGTPLQELTVPQWDLGVFIVIYSVIGAVLTYEINVTAGKGPVDASALVGLLAGLILPALYGKEVGNTLAVIVFCASFAGMSSARKIPRWYLIAIAGAVSALLFIYSMPHLSGAGGKLGTIAFASVLAVSGCMRLLKIIRDHTRGQESSKRSR
jgi:hypothetical protein